MGKFNLGIRVLLAYTLAGGMFNLAMLFYSDFSFFFGLRLTGFLAKMLDAGFTIGSFYMAYSIIRRVRLGYYVAVMIYFLSIMSAVFTSFFWHGELGSIMGPFLWASIILNSITLWYIFVIRGHFFGISHSSVAIADRVFVLSVMGFAGTLFVLACVFGLNFGFRTTKSVDNIMRNINEMTLTESMFFCEDNIDRDLCYVALVAKHSAVDDITRLCSRIDSDFYRFTCARAIR